MVNMLAKYKIFFILLFILFSHTVLCGVPFQNEYVQYYTIENGLTQNEVTGIIQDSKGFLWMATRGGLNKFDGYSFTTFKSKRNDGNNITNPSIECLNEDRKGNIWIGTKSGGVDLFNPNLSTSQNFNTSDTSKIRLSDNRIIDIMEDADGDMWFASWSNGITVYNPQKDSVSYIWSGNKVLVVKQFDRDHILFGGWGLHVYDKKEKKMTNLPLGQFGGEINDLVIDRKRQVVWLAGWGRGLLKYSLKDQSVIEYNIDSAGPSTYDAYKVTNGYRLMQDSNGEIWFGTWGKGLYRFNPATGKFVKIDITPFEGGEKNVDYNIILNICEDREGTVWVGTDGGGVCQIEEHPLFSGVSLTNNRGDGIKNYHVLSILKDHSGILWMGTRNGLYYSNNRKDFSEVTQMVSSNNLHKARPLSNDMSLIQCIYEDGQDNLWVGVGSGLYKIVKYRNHYYYENFSNPEQNTIHKVRCIYIGQNIILAGTQQNGLWVRKSKPNDDSGWLNFRPQNNSVLKNERITFVREDNKHRIWFGTYSGVYYYDIAKDEIKAIKLRDGFDLSSEIILSWCQYNDTSYFIGTPSGLNRLDEQPDGEFVVKKYYKEDGLPNDYIDALTTDDNGNLWISTNFGLSTFNPQKNTWQNFQKSDGLQGHSFSEGCVFKDKSGELFFGGTSGFNYFNPEDIKINSVLPQTNITSFRIHNKLVLPRQKWSNRVLINHDISDAPSITLTYRENEFSISFAAASYKDPERNQFKYRLVNNDNDEWIDSYGNHTAYFSNLKAGDYIFEVKGSNNHNIWSDKPATLKITILPPPWKSKWAFMIYIIMLLSIVWLIRWVAVREAELKHNLEMEKLKHEQGNRISEMKFQFFTNISHEFRTPLTLISAPLKELIKNAQDFNLQDEARDKIQLIYNNTNRLLKLVNQLLDFRKAETEKLKLTARSLNIEEFVSEVCYPFYELAKIKGINFRIDSNLKTKSIWVDRDKLEIILNNLISNAIKFNKQEGSVWVSLDENETEVILKVKDTGKGITPSAIPHIFERFYQDGNSETAGTGIGLAFVKHLVDLHQGIIEVESEPGHGAEFRLKLKKGDQHLNPEQKIAGEDSGYNFVRLEPETSRLLPQRKKKQVVASNDCILIVEDNVEVRQYIENLLQPLFRIESAQNGKEGLQKAIELIPDLIISDVMMPEMDGFELCDKIKSNDLTTNIPLILLTAKSADQYKLMGIQTGADDYISKPFDPDYLIEKVQKLLLSMKKLKKKYSKSIKLEPSNIEIQSSDEIFLRKCISIIEKNLQNPDFSINILAAELNMSSSSLYRKLKLLTNLSSNEFIRSIRIKRAAQLLHDKNRTVSEVAYEVGFNDMKHFRQVFHKQFNCSPTEYREKISNGSDPTDKQNY